MRPELYINPLPADNISDIYSILSIFENWINTRYKCLETYSKYFIPSAYIHKEFSEYLKQFSYVNNVWLFTPEYEKDNQETTIKPIHSIPDLFTPCTGQILPIHRLIELHKQGFNTIHAYSNQTILTYQINYNKGLSQYTVQSEIPHLNIIKEIEPYSMEVGQVVSIPHLISKYSKGD